MPLPTTYTYDTAEDYLRDEVLMDFANVLGWIDIAGTAATVVRVEASSYSTGDSVVTVNALTGPVKSGTVLRWQQASDDTLTGQAVQLSADAATGATSISVFTTNHSLSNSVYAPIVTSSGRVPYDSSEVYVPVIDETLIQLGLSDINLITAANAGMFRGRLKVEVWRSICAATASDHDFSSETGTMLRAQVHAHAIEQFAQAEDDFIQNFGPLKQKYIQSSSSSTLSTTF